MPLRSLRSLTPEELATGPAIGLDESLERGADDLDFLRNRLGELLSLKNISYHPGGDYLSGIKNDPQARESTRQILRDHNAEMTRFLGALLPDYAPDWHCGKVNFRPLEEKGRQISRHSSNELIHVDAFASGATHGDRTLRFFTNIHPTVSRR